MSNNYTARLKKLGEQLLEFQCKKKYKGKLYNDCEKVGLLMVSPVTEKLEELKDTLNDYKSKSNEEKVELIKGVFRELYSPDTEKSKDIRLALKKYLISKNISEKQTNNTLQNTEELNNLINLIDNLKLEQNEDKLKAIWRIFRVFEPETETNNKYNINQDLSNLLFDLVKKIILDEEQPEFLDIQYGGVILPGIAAAVVLGIYIVLGILLIVKKYKKYKENKKQKEIESQSTTTSTSTSTSVSIPAPPQSSTTVSKPAPQSSTSIQNSSVQESTAQQYPYQAF
jgi:hypothetical protein